MEMPGSSSRPEHDQISSSAMKRETQNSVGSLPDWDTETRLLDEDLHLSQDVYHLNDLVPTFRPMMESNSKTQSAITRYCKQAIAALYAEVYKHGFPLDSPPWSEHRTAGRSHQDPMVVSNHKSAYPESSYYTALSNIGVKKEKIIQGQLRKEDDYTRLLISQNLWPVDSMVEQNWSGRGQHARFEEDEQRLINEILEPVDHLGSTNSAVVQSVRCRRILLARKTIKCGKRTMTREEAISEVAHLDRLNHAHILRVIGTYVKGKNLSILLYPVAEYNLETFFEEYLDLSHSPTKERMRGSGLGFYSCLSSAVHYIHLKLTKHMDIKPQNILVRFTQGWIYTLFIADFGISRSYERLEDVETDGWTLFTRPYAAPEVARQDFRGLSADIFSLGCVFLEIFDTFESADLPSNSIKTKLKSNKLGDTSYQANLGVLRRHMADYDLCDRQQASKVNMISRMLSLHAADRPTAEELVNHLGERDCCKTGSVQLEAIRDDR